MQLVSFYNTGSGETATIPANVSDYNTIKAFTGYDEEAIIKSNLSVEGDVRLSLFHARQTMGSFLSSNKFDGLLMAKVYFHTGFLSTNTSCIKIKLKDLDGVMADANGVKDQRFPPNFKVVVNFRPEKDIKKIEIVKSPSENLSLIFTTKAEHESNYSMMELSGNTTSNGSNEIPVTDDSSIPPKVPPRLKTNSSLEKSSRSPTPTSMKSTSQESCLRVEDLISPVVDLPPEIPSIKSNNKNSTKTAQILIDTNSSEVEEKVQRSGNLHVGQTLLSRKEGGDLVRPASDTLLLDLGSESNSMTRKDNSPIHHSHQQLDKNNAASNTGATVDTLLDILGDTSSTIPSDLFGTDATPSNSTLIGNTAGSIKASSSAAELFMMGDTGLNNPVADTNLLGDFGAFAGSPIITPSSQQPQIKNPLLNPSIKPTSTADELIDNFLSGLDVNQGGDTKASAHSNRPNYNSAFFAAPTKQQTCVPQMSSMKVAPGTFNDLLGGFTATSQATNETRTIGELKKKEEMKQMTPLEAKVFAWKDGKARNLRALLCSLDKILWEGSNWKQCGMHQLVTENDVNRMYKRACLAVHPDKNRGTENEELAILLQTELNDAWAEYKKELS